MATTGNERHLRYTLLLVEGGTDILREVFKRETEKEQQNSGKNLDQILKDNETKLKLTLKDKKQQEKLFPTSGLVDTSKWDISLLATVILQLYGNCLTTEECDCIKQIRKLRNEEVAHPKSLSMSENEYNDARNKAAPLLIKLSNKLDRSVHNRCQEFIKKFNTGSIEIQTAIERVKNDETILENIQQLSERSEKIEEKVDLLCNNSDKIKEIHQLYKQWDQERTNCRSFPVLGTKMMLKGPDDPLTRQVETLVTAAFAKALKRTRGETENSKLMEAVTDIIDEINDLDDCKVSVKTECIRMTLQCNSCEGLLQLLEYLQSNEFKQRLLDLVLAVEEIFGDVFHITFEIERDSLEELINYYMAERAIPLDQRKETVVEQMEEEHSEYHPEASREGRDTIDMHAWRGLRKRSAMLHVAGGIVQILFDQRLHFLVIGCSVLMGIIISYGTTVLPAAIDRQDRRLDTAEKELFELHKQLAERDHLMENFDYLEGAYKDHKDQLSRMSKQRETFERKLDDLQTQVDKYQKYDRHIDELEYYMKKLENDLENVKEELNDTISKVSDMTKEGEGDLQNE